MGISDDIYGRIVGNDSEYLPPGGSKAKARERHAECAIILAIFNALFS